MLAMDMKGLIGPITNRKLFERMLRKRKSLNYFGVVGPGVFKMYFPKEDKRRGAKK